MPLRGGMPAEMVELVMWLMWTQHVITELVG